MEIDELTIKQAKELAQMFPKCAQDSPWVIGKIYLIRTVTMIQTGRLVAVTEHELVVEDAAWIADTGRFADALKTGKFTEVEPFPDGKVIIGRGAIIDAVQISVAPRDTK